MFSRERITLLALLLRPTLLALYVCYRILQPFIPAIRCPWPRRWPPTGLQHWLRSVFGRATPRPPGRGPLVACLISCPLCLPDHLHCAADHCQAFTPCRQAAVSRNGRDHCPSAAHLAVRLDWASRILNLQLNCPPWAMAGRWPGGETFWEESSNCVTQLVIMLFVLFFLYRDRESALRVLRNLVPLSDEEAVPPRQRIENTILATVNGSSPRPSCKPCWPAPCTPFWDSPASAIWGLRHLRDGADAHVRDGSWFGRPAPCTCCLPEAR